MEAHYSTKNRIWRNDGAGLFTEIANALTSEALNTMCIEWAGLLVILKPRARACGVHVECMWSAWGVHGEYMRCAWGVHGECMGSAWGVHGECMRCA